MIKKYIGRCLFNFSLCMYTNESLIPLIDLTVTE